jgi:hypothetical protein
MGLGKISLHPLDAAVTFEMPRKRDLFEIGPFSAEFETENG